MKRKCRILLTECADPAVNLAAEELLMKEVGEDEIFLFLWQNHDTVVIGRNQNAWQECDVEGFRREGGTVVRRKSGGGAVYHDLGNLNFTFLSRREQYDLTKNMTVVRNAVRMFGIDACLSGRNDLSAGGRKFSGNAFLDDGKVKLHHGTVLIRCDFDRMKRFLTPSKAKMAAKGVSSVEARVVNLSEFCPSLTPEAFREALIVSLGEVFAAEDTEIFRGYASCPGLSALEEAAELYRSDEWNLRRHSAFDIKLDIRGENALFTLYLTVAEGVITGAEVFTDSMDPEISRQLRTKLTGRRYNRDVITGILKESAGENLLIYE